MPAMHTGSGFVPARDEEFPETRKSRNRKKAVRKSAELLHEDVRRTYSWMEHLRQTLGEGWEPMD